MPTGSISSTFFQRSELCFRESAVHTRIFRLRSSAFPLRRRCWSACGRPGFAGLPGLLIRLGLPGFIVELGTFNRRYAENAEEKMLETVLKRFEAPDETRTFEKGKFELVRIGGMTIGR